MKFRSYFHHYYSYSMGSGCTCKAVNPMENSQITYTPGQNRTDAGSSAEKSEREQSNFDFPSTEVLGCFQALSKAKEGRKDQQQPILHDRGAYGRNGKNNVQFCQNILWSPEFISIIKTTLSHHYILSQIPCGQITNILQNMRSCTANEKTYIYQQDDPSFSYYIILQGKCQARINEKIEAELGVGDDFGGMGFRHGVSRATSIFALERCLLAELNRTKIQEIVNKLSSSMENEKKKVLEQFKFYQSLNDEAKNALASYCMIEAHSSERVIFRKGDPVSVLYIIQEGIAQFVENSAEFGAGDVINANATSEFTLKTLTKCRLLSISKQRVSGILGEDIEKVLRKMKSLELLRSCSIFPSFSLEQWQIAIRNMEFTDFNANELVFEKHSFIEENSILFLFGSKIKTKNRAKYYLPSSIIEPRSGCLLKESAFVDSYFAQGECTIGKVMMKSSAVLRNFTENVTACDIFLIKKLQSHSYWKTYACFHSTQRKKVLVKIMNRSKFSGNNFSQSASSEQKILKKISKYQHFATYCAKIVEQDFVILVIDLLEGFNLLNSVHYFLPLTTYSLKLIVAQLVILLEILHKNKIAYRDLKPENILCCEDGYLTLADFSAAKQLTAENKYKTKTIIGTPCYMAPEVIAGNGYSFAADWWSAGVIMYQLIYSRLPYGQNAQDPFQIYGSILNDHLNVDPNASELVDEITAAMIKRLLSRNEIQRWGDGYGQLKNSSYFSHMRWEELYRKKVECKIYKYFKSSTPTAQVIEEMITHNQLASLAQQLSKMRLCQSKNSKKASKVKKTAT